LTSKFVLLRAKALWISRPQALPIKFFMRAIVPNLVLRAAFGAAIIASLTTCSDQQTAQQRQAPPKPAIGAQTLESRSVTLVAELPGRTSAFLMAEIRPRVSGIVQSRNFQEGGEVKAGDVLYELDPTPFEAAYRNADAALKRANGAVPSARGRLDRFMSLSRQNAVSKQDFDDAQTALVQAEADVAAANAALETARINLGYTKIRAPIDGRIDASSVTPGALVTADQAQALATIRQLNLINVDVVQSSANILRLRKALAGGRMKTNGEFVTVELLLEDGSRYPNPGKLQFLDSSVSASAGTVSIRAIFPNPDRLLMPGMYVRAIVEEGVIQDGLLVPQRAVSRNARGEATARFVTLDSKIEERVLAVDRTVGNNWLVNAGVAAGDRIVIDGLQKAQVGQEVEVSAVSVDERTGEVHAVETQSNQATADRSSSDTSGTATR
jgi:membrane fusion protein (multidrug efflux system)